MKLIYLIEIVAREQASDLHLTANTLLHYRVQEKLQTFDAAIFTAEEL